MRRCYTMSPRFYFPIYNWRLNRYRFSQLIIRHCITRHILRRSPFPLCTINRSCICYYSRFYPLIPTFLWLFTTPNLNQSTFWGNICRCKYNIFPTTLPRASGYTTTLFWLPRCLYPMKHHLIYRIINLPNCSNHNNIYYLRSILIKTKSYNNWTHNHQRRMTSRMPPSISHLWRTHPCTKHKKGRIWTSLS